jgi:transposase
MAVAHRLLLIAYHVIVRRKPYRELGADYLERRRSPGTVDRPVQQLRDLGVEVTVTAQASPPSPTDLILAATP